MTNPDQDTSALDASSLFNVKGLVAVVTGGGSGIGLMITKALAANGASKVYILGRRLSTLQAAASATGPPGVVVPVTCDVTSVAALRATASAIQAQTGHINLLVCNSGIGGPYGLRPDPSSTSLDEFVEANMAAPIEEFTQTFAVNVAAVWYTTMAFLKLLAAGNENGNVEQKAQVVAVSSIGGFNKVNTGGFAYGQSKAAATHLVKQLSVVLPQWDIRANAICPGLYPSEMSAPILDRGPAITKAIIPLQRTGDEKDMGGLILYLASRAGAYCNGTVIISDGGRLTTFPSTF
ncbi:Uu.00g124890.m01.CDS01 [Anthostomella pinea]|uniref:Uu.00g124890.m01.CDS01 n=1 Tax=Anthostomella pinea TaxID=933095 RepID=A0AAI8VIM1_9PEZI|nr:Uu.00g124890.m01.CDS01 [Anthostomella pinea]